MNKDAFKGFIKENKQSGTNRKGKAVIYTRVSTKEQAENNHSLDTQLKYCKEFALKKGLDVIEKFGGTYESAKSDERKEFGKMLSFVNRKKDVSYIIVYSFDRFSRTGANGAYISEQLKKKGIVTLSATQEVDSSSASGTFQQNLYYIFSQFDNELRKDKCVVGIKERLRSGHPMGHIPFGYTNENPGRGNTPNIVINKDGRLLKKAFELKASTNLTYGSIISKLSKKGLVTTEKRLSNIFRNPFYCGLIISSHIPGEIVQGKHPKIVSESTFLRINEMLSQPGTGEHLNMNAEELPLKKFVKSADCGTPYTGYHKKKKNLWYYKNNRKGSKENRNAKVMNDMFAKLLGDYELADEKYKAPMIEVMLDYFKRTNENLLEESKDQSTEITELTKKLDRLEERFVFEEISKVQYDKFKEKLSKEKYDLEEDSYKGEIKLSNLEKAIKNVLNLSMNLSDRWRTGDLETKKKIQRMVFPDGILYDRKKDVYRTLRVNSLFSVIPLLRSSYGTKKKGINSKTLNLSPLVAGTGLEPVTFGL
jgi:site-specific DNA recombinase